MKLKTTLITSLLMAGSISVAHATTYNVSARFADGGVQHETLFNGSFDWDGSSVTNFTGALSESMWEWYDSDSQFHMGSGMSETMYYSMNPGTQSDYMIPVGGYSQGDAPLLELNYMVDGSLVQGSAPASGYHAVTAFLMGSGGAADTNVVAGGGYDISSSTSYYGLDAGDGARNWNAFFTLVFDESNPTDTSLTLSQMEYADCNGLGMMMDTCMVVGAGVQTMGGFATDLSITAVPVPAAVWLFGGALVSLFGAGRRNSVPA